MDKIRESTKNDINDEKHSNEQDKITFVFVRRDRRGRGRGEGGIMGEEGREE